MGFIIGGIAASAIGVGISAAEKAKQLKKYTYKPVNLQNEQSKATAGNLAILPQATDLAEKTSMANQDITLQMLNKAIPQYGSMTEQESKVIDSLLKGEIPEDVQDQIARSSSAWGVGSGLGVGDMSGRRGLRNLGMTSLQLSEAGLSAADQFLRTTGTLTKAPQMNVGAMFVSPMEAADFAAKQAGISQETKLAQLSMGNSMMDAGSSLASIGGMLTGYGMTKKTPVVTTTKPADFDWSKYGSGFENEMFQRNLMGGND
jgi:hypothetical protein